MIHKDKLTRKEIRAQAKPWLTQGILNSIHRKDRLLRKCIQAKDAIRKEILHAEFKTLRNQITYIISVSKKTHYQRYFTENHNNIKKTWSGIKNIINIRTVSGNQPTSMMIDNCL